MFGDVILNMLPTAFAPRFVFGLRRVVARIVLFVVAASVSTTLPPTFVAMSKPFTFPALSR